MAIFIATLAFPNADALAAAKLAVLVGSAGAAVLGLALGSRLLRRPS
jgi:Na+/H+ antiporter NhaA